VVRVVRVVKEAGKARLQGVELAMQQGRRVRVVGQGPTTPGQGRPIPRAAKVARVVKVVGQGPTTGAPSRGDLKVSTGQGAVRCLRSR
jgi:hypothetical protein